MNQRTLVYTREERLMLIEAATFAPAVSRTIQRRLKGLLLQLEYCEGRLGCFPGQELLGAKMGVDRVTIIKWVKALRLLRLLDTDRRVTFAGPKQLNYHVRWANLRSFCTTPKLQAIAASLAALPSGHQVRERISEPAQAGVETAATAEVAPPVGRARKKFTAPQKTSQRDVNSVDHAWSTDFTAPYRKYPKDLPPESKEAGDLISMVDAAGVDQAASAVGQSLARGCLPTEIRSAVEHFQSLAGVKPGALFCKLVRMIPGESVARRFPRSERAAAVRQQQQRQDVEQDRRIAADAAERQQDQRQLLDLEANYGATLDAMSLAERKELAARVFERNPFLASRSIDSPLVRERLLKHLQEHRS